MMDAETLRRRAQDAIECCRAEYREDDAAVLRALYDRAFPAWGGPPTLAEYARELRRWLVIHPQGGLFLVELYLHFHHFSGERGLKIRCEGWSELNDRSQRTRMGGPGWNDLRCRPVDADGNAVPREPA